MTVMVVLLNSEERARRVRYEINMSSLTLVCGEETIIDSSRSGLFFFSGRVTGGRAVKWKNGTRASHFALQPFFFSYLIPLPNAYPPSVHHSPEPHPSRTVIFSDMSLEP